LAFFFYGTTWWASLLVASYTVVWAGSVHSLTGRQDSMAEKKWDGHETMGLWISGLDQSPI